MARPRKWASEAERLAAYRRNNRTETSQEEPVNRTDILEVAAPIRTDTQGFEPSIGFVAFRDCPDVPRSLFYPEGNRPGSGRGVPVEHKGKRYVLVSRGMLFDEGVVTEEDWLARLDQRCGHGRNGWSCHVC